MLYRQGWAAVLSVILVGSILTVLPVESGAVNGEARVADPNTVFHRVWVVGGSNNAQERDSFLDDRNEARNDVERNPDRTNQAPGSTSTPLFEPSRDNFRATLDRLKTIAKPGEEVTIIFIGHGGGGPNFGLQDFSQNPDEPFDEHIWLNDNVNPNSNAELAEIMTDDEMADWLQGFAQGVTLVLVMDSCWGGGFAGGRDDVQESRGVAVIGTSVTCAIDPSGAYGAAVDTLGEVVADGAGEGQADANGDGVVTAQELKDWLESGPFGWELGAPNDTQIPAPTPQSGKSKCVSVGGSCELPSIVLGTLDILEPGSEITLTGQNFGSNAEVSINISTETGMLDVGTARTDQDGSFSTDIVLPDLPDGEYLLLVRDADGFEDWVPLTMGEVVDDVRVVMKHTKRTTLVSVKNNGEEPLHSVALENLEGNIRFVKARGWDRERIDDNTVRVMTDDRPIAPGRSLILLLVTGVPTSIFQWGVADSIGNLMGAGAVTERSKLPEKPPAEPAPETEEQERSIKVVDETTGKGIHRAIVIVSDKKSGKMVVDPTNIPHTGNDGVAQIALQPGKYTIRITAPGYKIFVDTNFEIKKNSTGFEYALEPLPTEAPGTTPEVPISVFFTVLEEESDNPIAGADKPIAGAKITFSLTGIAGAQVGDPKITQENGRTAKFLDRGDYHITVEAEGYETFSGPLKVEGDENKMEVEIKLKPLSAATPEPPGTPAPSPEEEEVATGPASGTYDVSIKATVDPAGHEQFIGEMPDELTVSISDSSITITGSPPWVEVTGTLNEDGSFTAEGSGPVAGIPDVKVRLEGKITDSKLEGDYTMGVDGKLPQEQSITYQVKPKTQ